MSAHVGSPNRKVSPTSTTCLPAVPGWRATECLHVGRWSRVYRAMPTDAEATTTADYVLKIVPTDDDATSQVARRQFARSWNVACAVQHAHIAPILAGDPHAEQAWYVQPDAGEVGKLSARANGPLPQTLWLFRQLAAALAALHENGWLHGDVCPRNVAVRQGHHASLLDLGLARRLQTEECDLTQTPLQGHFYYAAPEAIADQGQLNAASDIYAWGLMLVEALTGRHLLPFTTFDEQRALKLMLPKLTLDDFRVSLSTPHLLFLNRLLSREPLRRPTAAACVEYLVGWEVEAFSQWPAVA